MYCYFNMRGFLKIVKANKLNKKLRTISENNNLGLQNESENKIQHKKSNPSVFYHLENIFSVLKPI